MLECGEAGMWEKGNHTRLQTFDIKRATIGWKWISQQNNEICKTMEYVTEM